MANVDEKNKNDLDQNGNGVPGEDAGNPKPPEDPPKDKNEEPKKEFLFLFAWTKHVCKLIADKPDDTPIIFPNWQRRVWNLYAVIKFASIDNEPCHTGQEGA